MSFIQEEIVRNLHRISDKYLYQPSPLCFYQLKMDVYDLLNCYENNLNVNDQDKQKIKKFRVFLINMAEADLNDKLYIEKMLGFWPKPRYWA